MQNAESLESLLHTIDSLYEQKDYEAVIARIYAAESHFIDTLDDARLSALEVIKGFSQLALRKESDAMLSFENALNLNPESSQACVGLGEVFYLQNKDENARLMYGWAVKLDKENPGARRGLEKVTAALAAAEALPA